MNGLRRLYDLEAGAVIVRPLCVWKRERCTVPLHSRLPEPPGAGRQECPDASRISRVIESFRHSSNTPCHPLRLESREVWALRLNNA